MTRSTRFVLLILAACFCFFLTACSSSGVSIKETELAGFEKNLLKSLSDTHFLYEVEINSRDAKEWKVQIDEYSKGKFVRTPFSSVAPLQDKARPIQFKVAVVRQVTGKKAERWTILEYNKDSETASTADIGDVKTDYTSSSSKIVDLPLTLKEGEQKVIGALVLSDGNAITSLGGFEDKATLKAATNYDKVYLIKAELK